LNPVWPYHQQYYELAQSLSRGSVSIDVGSDEMLDALAAMENPYDNSARMQSVPGAGSVWDTCYYKGKFYVYFGVVPVLLFYLPWYLLFHSAFPTWLGVFLAGTGAVGGMYYLLGQIRRRWFQELPYGLYLVLAAISANSLNLFCAMLHADFYYLPILLALCFSLWGLGLAVSAVDRWRQGLTRVGVRLAGGALCLALTAGCRPQFLAGSFLLLPLLLPTFMENRKVRRAWQYLAAAALPYLLVAAGLMYYNFIRFGSVFDFGAAYNLTTNDMTQRGFHLERLPDGFFMYLFQPPSLRLEFPFVEVTSFYSTYPGTTIMDWTFGGAFWTRCILLGVLGIVNVRRELREKKLYGFAVLSFLMALVVVAADTELSGILNRYFMDFLWLLVIPAAVILMQLWEKYRNADCRRWILWFIILAGAAGILCELGMAFRGSGLVNDNAHRYYIIKSLFQ
jgi:hypothetical protein